jgi:serine/threonine protein kinase
LNDEEKVQDLLQTFVGSEAYMSPERLLGKNYSYASDIWSFGIIVAYCLFGVFPFNLKENSTSGNNMFGLLKIVQKDDFIDFTKVKCSDEVVDFIKKCCIQEPNDRPSASELLKHDFITKNVKEGETLKEFVQNSYVKKKRDMKQKTQNSTDSPVGDLTKTLVV